MTWMLADKDVRADQDLGFIVNRKIKNSNPNYFCLVAKDMNSEFLNFTK